MFLLGNRQFVKLIMFEFDEEDLEAIGKDLE